MTDPRDTGGRDESADVFLLEGGLIMRLAREEDLDACAALYDAARTFMHANGNPTQWPGVYPVRSDAEGDWRAGHLWVAEREGTVVACMSVMPGPDPTYAQIDGEGWLDDEPYTVMHRLAVGDKGRGTGSACLRWLVSRYGNVRADTHADNLPMQHALEKAGFVRRGIITVEDGTPRLAYHHVPLGDRILLGH